MENFVIPQASIVCDAQLSPSKERGRPIITCSICQGVLKSPVVMCKAKGCGKMVCKACYAIASATTESCLFCFEPQMAELSDSSSVHQNFMKAVQRISIKCLAWDNAPPNEPCPEKLCYGKPYYDHIKMCPRLLVRCANESLGCKEWFMRKSASAHNSTCAYAQEKCLNCLKLVLRKDIPQHKLTCTFNLKCRICHQIITVEEEELHWVLCRHKTIVDRRFDDLILRVSEILTGLGAEGAPEPSPGNLSE